MTNPSKKKPPAAALSRFVSDRKLPLQTGFPTSLADLVVKHRNRLRKPKHPKHPSPSDPPSLCHEIQTCPEVRHLSRGADQRLGLGLGFRVWFVVLVVLVALAIERRRLVVGIVIAAVGFRLLDRFVGFFRSSCGGNVRLDENFVGLRLGERALVSPIGSFSDCNDSASERGSFAGESVDCSDCDAENSTKKKKKKKLFKKLSLKSFRSKKEKDEKLMSSESLGSVREEGVGAKEQGIRDEIDELVSDDNASSFAASSVVSDHEMERLEVVRDYGCKVDSRSYLKLALFSIILMGLVGGKGLAVVLTVSWFLLSKSTQSLWKRRKGCPV